MITLITLDNLTDVDSAIDPMTHLAMMILEFLTQDKTPPDNTYIPGVSVLNLALCFQRARDACVVLITLTTLITLIDMIALG